MPTRPDVVAIFNTSTDTTNMLRILFEHAGFVVVTAFTYEIRDGKTDLGALMRQHRPSVVVYDVAIPYDQNWRLFEHIRDSPVCAGVKFVITTTNAAQLEKVAGARQYIHEIVGKPYDLDNLLRAVVDAAQASR